MQKLQKAIDENRVTQIGNARMQARLASDELYLKEFSQGKCKIDKFEFVNGKTNEVTYTEFVTNRYKVGLGVKVSLRPEALQALLNATGGSMDLDKFLPMSVQTADHMMMKNAKKKGVGRRVKASITQIELGCGGYLLCSKHRSQRVYQTH
jgi:hypothetical protein